MIAHDLSESSMHDLFRLETENQTQVLIAGLLELERNPGSVEQLENCMRAAHSLKGAARIVDLATGVTLAHAVEDCFVAAQRGRVDIGREHIDLLLRAVDLLVSIGKTPDAGPDRSAVQSQVDQLIAELANAMTRGSDQLADVAPAPDPSTRPSPTRTLKPEAVEVPPPSERDAADRVLRITVENLNRLVGLAGESFVNARWLKSFRESLLKLKRLQYESSRALDNLRDALPTQAVNERAKTALDDAYRRAVACQQFMSLRLAELEASDHYSTGLAHRLYDQALACRMRPFSDGVTVFARMVRDLAASLGKQVRFEIDGASTLVDRDILEKLEAPLGHLLRNAVDHGIELPEERRASGKPGEGVVRLQASHSAGTLQVVVADDGRGIDLTAIKNTVVARRLIDEETASKLSEKELLEFLFLPGFTTKDAVTDISGRGFGLDVMRDMLKQVRGSVHVVSYRGAGTSFQLQLPLTLSVVRTLLVNVSNEPYAFPLSQILRAVKIAPEKIGVLEGRQHFDLDGQKIALVAVDQLLSGGHPNISRDEVAVVVVSSQQDRYGFVVDSFIGERELVVQPLDPRLGKIKNITAAALMEDGSPILIMDVEDLVLSAGKLAATGNLNKMRRDASATGPKERKRILIVDDSLTVREVQRKLLVQHGYEIEVAVDGLEGWDAARNGRFDLIITDIDMPRMDGIELVNLVKKDPQLKAVPVIIVSYKDREEDRRRGLDAGADYYLAKSSFHDESLLQAVVDLVGEGGE